jgi:ABC-2 type transport system permease protein
LKEEHQKTAEFLLTKPLTRGEVFFTKWLLMALNITLFNVIGACVGFIAILLVKTGNIPIKPYLILSFSTFLLNFLFGAIGLFISTLVKRPKPITTFSIGIVLILYFVLTISRITPSGEKFGYISPFKYVNVNVLSPGYGIDFGHLLYFVGSSVVLTTLAYQIYKRKDIFT